MMMHPSSSSDSSSCCVGLLCCWARLTVVVVVVVVADLVEEGDGERNTISTREGVRLLSRPLIFPSHHRFHSQRDTRRRGRDIALVLEKEDVCSTFTQLLLSGRNTHTRTLNIHPQTTDRICCCCCCLCSRFTRLVRFIIDEPQYLIHEGGPPRV